MSAPLPLPQPNEAAAAPRPVHLPPFRHIMAISQQKERRLMKFTSKELLETVIFIKRHFLVAEYHATRDGLAGQWLDAKWNQIWQRYQSKSLESDKLIWDEMKTAFAVRDGGGIFPFFGKLDNGELPVGGPRWATNRVEAMALVTLEMVKRFRTAIWTKVAGRKRNYQLPHPDISSRIQAGSDLVRSQRLAEAPAAQRVNARTVFASLGTASGSRSAEQQNVGRVQDLLAKVLTPRQKVIYGQNLVKSSA